MSVTYPRGFRAAGVAAGLKQSGNLDVAVVLNDGPQFIGVGTFTTNQVKAAPVVWSQQVCKVGQLKAVLFNSGGANACTGPAGFQDTHQSAEALAALMPNTGAAEIAICSTGLIGIRLDMPKLLAGVNEAMAYMPTPGDTTAVAAGGEQAAQAIMTTDSVAKTATFEIDGVRFGGMAKGAGMLAPSLATMLVCITTDATVDADSAREILKDVCTQTFDRIDADGCTSTNDTVLLLANGAAAAIQPTAVNPAAAFDQPPRDGHVTNTPLDLVRKGVFAIASSLAAQLIADAEGATKTVRIDVTNANSPEAAKTIARAVARDSLVKCALNGSDPNWGRILAAVGAAGVPIEPDQISIRLNDVLVAQAGAAVPDMNTPDLSGREISIAIDLSTATNPGNDYFIWTTDLSAQYVHENSAYST